MLGEELAEQPLVPPAGPVPPLQAADAAAGCDDRGFMDSQLAAPTAAGGGSEAANPATENDARQPRPSSPSHLQGAPEAANPAGPVPPLDATDAAADCADRGSMDAQLAALTAAGWGL